MTSQRRRRLKTKRLWLSQLRRKVAFRAPHGVMYKTWRATFNFDRVIAVIAAARERAKMYQELLAAFADTHPEHVRTVEQEDREC